MNAIHIRCAREREMREEVRKNILERKGERESNRIERV